MSGVLEIVAEIIWTIISEGINTVFKLFKLFFELLKAASPLSASGPTGFILSALIIGGLGFFIGKYIFHVGKTSPMLIVVGIIVFVAVTSSVI